MFFHSYPSAIRFTIISIIVFSIASFLQLATGHLHAVQVGKTQPAKMAAFEGLWETESGAGMRLFGIPDEEKEVTHFEISIPKMLSILIFMDPDAEVTGLKAFPKDERPPVFISFCTYHIMIALGMLFILMSLYGLFLMYRGKLWETSWFLKLLLFTIPLPHIGNQTGWMAAEIGRQPWAVYGILKTSDAASVVVPAWQILFTLIMFILLYSLLFFVFVKVVTKIIKKGPEQITKYSY